MKKGFTIIELVLYIAIFVISFALIINTLLLFGSTQARLASVRALNRSAITSMERLSREINRSTTIDDANSLFGVPSGRLVTTAVIPTGATTSIDFYIDGDVLKVREGGADTGALTSDGVSVDEFYVYKLSGESTGVRVLLTLHAGNTQKTFYLTKLMKGSY